jgi:hypothetical protein
MAETGDALSLAPDQELQTDARIFELMENRR